MKNKKYFIILILIILVGLFFRVYPFEPKSWIGEVDTLIVREALDLGKGIIEKDYSFLQETIAYPFVLPFLLLFCYGIFYLLGSWFGLFSSVQGFISYLFFHIDEFYWLSRILIGVFGILSVVLVYLIVREIFSRAKEKKIILGSLLAAYVLSFSLLSIQFSQQVRPHVPVAFFILLSFYLYLLCLKKKSWNSYLLLVLSAGLAVGTFIGGIFAFVFVILANYFLERKDSSFKFINFLKTFFSFRFIVGLIVFLIIFLLFCPYVLFNFNLDISTISSGDSVSIDLFNSSFMVRNLGMGFITISKMLFSQELTLGLLLVLFLFLYFVYKKNIVIKDNFYKQAIIGWWAFVTSYSIVIGFLDFGGRFRLLCSIIPFLSIGLGILLINVFDNLNKYKKLIFLIIIILLSFEFIQAARFVQLIDRPYSRDEASQWLEENVSSDELILFQQPIQTLTPTKESIEVHSFLSGFSLSQRNQFLLSLELSDYPSNSKSILDFGDVMKYKDNDNSAVYEFLKEVKPDYFVLLFRSMDLEREEYVEYQIAQKQGQLVKKFSPFKNETNRELLFPSGLDNPLIDLWAAKQLGPTVEIYKLDWNND